MSALRVFPIVLCLIAVAAGAGTDYIALREASVRRCEGIDPAKYQSGLLFNPEGYRSYYERSQCLQSAAVLFRDESMCEQVRRRSSLFFSSWGVSPEQCHKLVAEGVTADRATLEQMKRLYASDPIRLRDLHVERNGNGRDFDFIPVFSGSYAHGYTLTFEIMQAGSADTPVLLHSSGYYVDGTSKLRIYVRQADIRKVFPDFAPNRRYRVRATVTLDVGSGGVAGYWSDAFIEQTFPVRERTHSITIETTFQSLAHSVSSPAACELRANRCVESMRCANRVEGTPS